MVINDFLLELKKVTNPFCILGFVFFDFFKNLISISKLKKKHIKHINIVIPSKSSVF